MKIIVSNVSGIPIYEQIKNQIKGEILSASLVSGEKLPSLRTLAKELKVSVLTVNRAYTELEEEGFIANLQGKGCFVMESGSELLREQLVREAEDHLSAAIQAGERAQIPLSQLHQLLDMLAEVNKHE